MSEQWSESGSEQPVAEREPSWWAENGANRSETVGVAEEVAEGSDRQPVAGEGDQPGHAPVAVDAQEVASPSDGADGGASATEEAVEIDPLDDGTAFIADLVRAMQTTASGERVRIMEETDRRRQAHIDQVRAQQASEADRIRELADEDMRAIEAWAEAEARRIQVERERRASEVNEDLETSLAEHGSKIDREIAAAEAKIAAYRSDVDAYFEGFDRETDLVAIALQATRRPLFPSLEAVAEAETDAQTETVAASADDAAAEPSPEVEVVGVMAPDAAREPVSWPIPPVTSEVRPAEAVDEVGEDADALEPAETVAAGTGPRHEGPGSIFHAVPVLRPMDWLRREGNGGDRSNRDG